MLINIIFLKFNNFIILNNFFNSFFTNFVDICNIIEILSIVIFLTGLSVISFNSANLIITLIGIELLLLAANINFLISAIINNDGSGLVFVLCILTISAAETAIGTGLLIVRYSIRQTVEFSDLITLQD